MKPLDDDIMFDKTNKSNYYLYKTRQINFYFQKDKPNWKLIKEHLKSEGKISK